MKIYDITQELFSCCVYPGDPSPKYSRISQIESGDTYNLSEISLCTHNGTHIDAPRHYMKDGKTVDQIDISKFVGMCSVIEQNEILTKEQYSKLLQGMQKKILFKGNVEMTDDLVSAIIENGIELIGVESQTIGKGETIDKYHTILLSREIIILEGIRLADVSPSDYLLSAAPLNLGGLEGSPCRAVLIDN